MEKRNFFASNKFSVWPRRGKTSFGYSPRVNNLLKWTATKKSTGDTNNNNLGDVFKIEIQK